MIRELGTARTALLLGTLWFLQGCAGANIFISYPGQAAKLKLAINANDEASALERLDKRRDKADKILYLMERGRIAQIADLHDESQIDFEQAIQAMIENEEKAKISATGVGAQAATVLTNDNAIPYKGDVYERVFVHQFQTLNYLANRDLEGATVEVRRAAEVQQQALESHDRELAAAEKEAEEKNVRVDASSYDSRFAEMDAAMGKAKSSFQNAYTFYTSALIYEAEGEPGDAYIDYKKALEIFPGNYYVQKSVLRLGRRLGMREDYERFSAQFGFDADETNRGDGTLVVLFESGFVPPKQQIKFPLPTPHGAIAVAFPIYKGALVPYNPLDITVEGDSIGSTEPIVNVQSLAARALKEKIPAIIIRQTVRAVAKAAMLYGAKQVHFAAQIVATVYNIASENADLRSWLTLPNTAQVLSGSLTPGEHTVSFSARGLSGQMSVPIRAGKITILRVIGTDARLIAETYEL